MANFLIIAAIAVREFATQDDAAARLYVFPFCVLSQVMNPLRIAPHSTASCMPKGVRVFVPSVEKSRLAGEQWTPHGAFAPPEKEDADDVQMEEEGARDMAEIL